MSTYSRDIFDMFGKIKKIEIKRKYIYVTHYGKAPTVIIDKKDISHFRMDVSNEKELTEIGAI